MKIAAVIVAGGRSSRMGREKAFELIRGRSILEHVAQRLRAQADAIIINANGGGERFAGSGFPVIGDVHSEAASPLAGLHAALGYATAQGFDSALTVPSDCPFLPENLVSRLAATRRSAAIAGSGGQAHYLTGLWAGTLLGRLELAFDEPRLPRLQDWATRCEAAVIEWPVHPYDPFFNVNTPEELAEANRIAAEFSL